MDLNFTLKEAGARSGSSLRQSRARSLMVVVEMALAVVLLAGAGLLLHTVAALHSVAPGFDPHNLLTMQIGLTGDRYDQTAAVSSMARLAPLIQRNAPVGWRSPLCAWYK